MEINGDVTMETNKQPESESSASQQTNKGLLTFTMGSTKTIEFVRKLKLFSWTKFFGSKEKL